MKIKNLKGILLFFLALSISVPLCYSKEKKQEQPSEGEKYISKFMEVGRFQAAQYQYEKEKKSATIAVILNVILYPGLGNLYAGGYIKGTLELAWWFNFIGRLNAALENPYTTNQEKEALSTEFSAIFIVALVTAYTDVAGYNKKLRKKLGLEVAMKIPENNDGLVLALQKRF